mmetsp:Transcript_68/g.73  ORF Transcript_68/g.73 Transcript_68/m.73 type:complete len:117 (+) Transcript_68:176-526(+)
MYVYLILIAYSIVFLVTGATTGKWIINQLAGIATQVFQMMGAMTVIYYLMGQGPEVIGLLANGLIYFGIPFGFLGYALQQALKHADSEEEKEVKIMQDPQQYFVAPNMKSQQVSML